MKQDKFYRRAYNLINDLRLVYKDGYNSNIIEELKKIQITKNESVYKSEIEALSLILISTLIGLNKECLENKYDDLYCEEILEYDFRNMYNINTEENFESKRILNTKYDNFISVSNFNDDKLSDLKVIDFVRNAFLHSQFQLHMKDNYSVTFIKNKNFFEAYLLNPNFYYYMISMFSNIPTIGKTEKQMFCFGNLKKANNKQELIKIIKENYMVDFSKIDYNINLENINKYMDDEKIQDDIEYVGFTDNGIEILADYIIKNYPNFFNESEEEQIKKICIILEYIFQNKRVYSNWIVHFYYMIRKLFSNDIDLNFFLNDEDYNFCIDDALNIVQLYLILFRFQNYYLEPIDYDKVDISNVKIFDEASYNLIKESMAKIQSSDLSIDNDMAYKITICQIIRNSLAHGNFNTTIVKDKNEIKTMYIFKDIYKNKEKDIYLDVESIRKFISSDAFKPNNSKIKKLIID